VATLPSLPPDVDEHRDVHWWRDPTRHISTVIEAERFIEQAGFAACLTDSRRPGPSLYVAVCGRRDAVMPRNPQKDPEASLTWHLKDQILRRGKVYYGKLARGKATFIAPRMVPHFHAIWGLRKSEESRRLSRPARVILKVLRHEWEMGTADLRQEARLPDRAAFSRALDELQAAMLVIPPTWCTSRRSPIYGRWQSAGFRRSCGAACRATWPAVRLRAVSCAARD